MGFRRRKLRGFKTWLSEESIKKIEEKRDAKQNIGRQEPEHKHSKEYSKKNKVQESTRRDKRTFVDRLMATDAQKAAEKNDIKALYNITCQLSVRKTNTNKPVKGRHGSMLSKPEDQLSRWKEHFSSLLNGIPAENPPDLIEGEELACQLS